MLRLHIYNAHLDGHAAGYHVIMKIAVANAMYKLPLASIGALGGTDIMPVCKPLHGAACLKIRSPLRLYGVWGVGRRRFLA